MRMKKLIVSLLLLVFLIPSVVFADVTVYDVTVYVKTALTGSAGALDSIDGTGLVDGDLAFVFASNVFYTYRLDDDSGAAESSPSVIAPDANGGNKRWILQNTYNSSYSSISGTPAQYQWGEWVNATTIKGTAVTGSKVVCTDANGSPVACTNLSDLAFSSYIPATRFSFAGANNVLTYTGDFSLGITLTGATAVTFPASGTLATTTLKPSNLAIADQAAGDLLYFNGTNWVRLAKDAGKYLKSGDAAVSWDTPAGSGDFLADGTVPMTAGIQFEGTADEYETTLTVTDPTGEDKTVTLPNATGTVNVAPTTTTANQVFLGTTTAGLGAWSAYTLAAPGDAGGILQSDGTNWARVTTFTGTMSDDAAQFISATASKGTRKLVQSSISDGILLTDTPIITGNVTWTNISQGEGTFTRVFEESLNVFTVKQEFDATAGLQVGSTGVLITSDNDGAITLKGAGEGYDEDLSINLDDTENTAVVSSSTGVTDLSLSALHLATTGNVTGRVYVVSDADGKTLAGKDLYGSMQISTGAGTWVLPDIDAAAGTGQCACFYATAAHVVTIDPDAEDKIRLAGVLGAAGASIDNNTAEAAGDFICLMVTDFDGDVAHWTSLGSKGTWAVTP